MSGVVAETTKGRRHDRVRTVLGDRAIAEGAVVWLSKQRPRVLYRCSWGEHVIGQEAEYAAVRDRVTGRCIGKPRCVESRSGTACSVWTWLPVVGLRCVTGVRLVFQGRNTPHGGLFRAKNSVLEVDP